MENKSEKNQIAEDEDAYGIGVLFHILEWYPRRHPVQDNKHDQNNKQTDEKTGGNQAQEPEIKKIRDYRTADNPRSGSCPMYH